jgi:hypothetical protein
VGHGDGGGDGRPIGQAIIGQTWPLVHGGGQGGGQETAAVLVAVLVALTVQGGGQTIIAVLLVPLVSGQGGGHVTGWAPVVVLVTQGGTQTTVGHNAPGGQLGGGGQGGGGQEGPPAHGGWHGSEFAGARSARACLVP